MHAALGHELHHELREINELDAVVCLDDTCLAANGQPSDRPSGRVFDGPLANRHRRTPAHAPLQNPVRVFNAMVVIKLLCIIKSRTARVKRITAGMFTPDQLVDRVEQRIREFAAARADGTSQVERGKS
jgi:hypothetical protein